MLLGKDYRTHHACAHLPAVTAETVKLIFKLLLALEVTDVDDLVLLAARHGCLHGVRSK